MKTEIGYKLFRVRKDGTLGTLFINRKAVLKTGKWMWCESHPTKGFAYRPFWHVTGAPHAPHLSMKGRVWKQVEMRYFTEEKRPASQGGIWYLAKQIRIVE